jgi:hypothetical protein
VSFAQSGVSTLAGPDPLLAVAPVLALLGALALPIVLIAAIDRLGITPPWLTRLAVSALVVALLWGLGRLAIRAYRRGMDSMALPLRADPAARVRVVAWTDQARELLTVDRAPFEPEEFRAFLPDRAPGWFRERRAAVGTTGWNTVMPLVWYIPVLVMITSGRGAVDPIWAVPALGLAFAVVGWLFRRPTYVRVTPGTVEVLRYPTLGKGEPDVTRIDVASHPVVLDVKSGRLVAGPEAFAEPNAKPDSKTETDTGTSEAEPSKAEPAPPAEPTRSLNLAMVLRRAEAVRAIYAACISPPLTPRS